MWLCRKGVANVTEPAWEIRASGGSIEMLNEEQLFVRCYVNYKFIIMLIIIMLIMLIIIMLSLADLGRVFLTYLGPPTPFCRKN